MSATKYSYSISEDFPNAKVDSTRLAQEIVASAITIALDCINTAGDVCDVVFKDELPTGDEGILDSLVAAHSGEPLPAAAQTVHLDGPETSDGKPIFLSSLFPGGVYLYYTGAGDTTNVGDGTQFALSTSEEGNEALEISFRDWYHVSGGFGFFSGAELGDYVSMEYYAPATAVTPNALGEGNCNVVNSVVIVPAAGNGAYDVDLETANIVPAYDEETGEQSGYWDWSEPDTGRGTITASATPGAAKWYLFTIDIALTRPMNRIGILGSHPFTLPAPEMKAKKLTPHAKLKFTLHHGAGTHVLKLTGNIMCARKKTV